MPTTSDTIRREESQASLGHRGNPDRPMPGVFGIVGGILLLGLAIVAFAIGTGAGPTAALYGVASVLLVAGLLEIAGGVRSRGAAGSALLLGAGVVTGAAGALAFFARSPSATYLSFVLMGMFALLAVLRIGLALKARPLGRRVWYAASALLAVAFFVASLIGLPPIGSATFALGLVIGADLFLFGCAEIAAGIAGRGMHERTTGVRAEPLGTRGDRHDASPRTA